MRRIRRVARSAAWVALSLVTFAVLVVIGGLFWARSDAGHRKLLAIALEQARHGLRGELRIGRLSGDLTRALVLDDVELRDLEGQPAIRARRVELRYDLLGLIRHELRIEQVAITGGWVRARTLRDGKLNLSELAQPSTPSTRPLDITVKRLAAESLVRAELEGRTVHAHLIVEGGVSKHGATTDVNLTRLDADSTHPLAALSAHGGVHLDGNLPTLRDLHVELSSRGGELRELDARLALRGPWQITLDARGPPSRVALALVVRPPRGELRVDGEVGVWPHLRGTEIAWQGRAHLREVDPGAAWEGAPHGRIAFDASARGVGARGTVELERLTSDAAGAHARAHGHAALGSHLTGELYLDVEARDLSRLATLGALAGRLNLHAHLLRGVEHTQVDADLQGARIAVAAARLDRIDARVHTRDLEGTALLSAQGISASGVRVSHLELAASGTSSALALELDASGPHGDEVALRAHGVPLRERGGFGADGSIDRLRVALHGQKWETTRSGHLRVDHASAAGALDLASGTARLHAAGRYGREDGRLDVTASGRSLDVQRLAATFPWPWPGRRPSALPATDLDVDLRLGGTTGEPVADLSLRGRALPNDRLGFAGARLALSAHYQDERVRGQLSTTSGEQSLEGTLDTPLELEGVHPLHVDLTAKNIQLDKWRYWLPRSLSTLHGRGDLTARLWGTTRKPQLEAAIDLPSWDFATLRHSRARLTVSYVGNRLRADLGSTLMVPGRLGLSRTAGAVHLVVTAPIDLSRSLEHGGLAERLEHQTPIDADAELKGLDLARLPLGQLGLSLPVLAGIVDGTLALDGTLHHPRASSRLRVQALQVGPLGGIALAVRADYQDSRARIELDARLHDAPLLSARADGQVDFQRVVDHQPWKDGPLRVDVKVAPYDLARVASRGGQLAGQLAGSFEARGTLAHPTGRLDLRADALRVGAMQFLRCTLDGSFDGRRAIAKLLANEQAGGSLSLETEVPVAAARPMRLAFAAHAFAIDVTHLGALRRLRTRLDAAVDVSGTRAAPQLAGYARIDDGELGMAADPRLYNRLKLDLAIANGAIALKQLGVSVAGGSVHASGTAKLAGFRLGQVDLYAEANRFPVASGAIGVWLDAHLEVHGHREGGVLVGQLNVKSATAHLPKLATGKKLQSTGPLADVVYVDEAARRQRAAKERASQESGQIELRAHIPGPLQIRSPELMTDLKGDLDVAIVGGVAKLSGQVETTWGWVQLLGRRYQIEHARAAFDGEPDPDPDLDLRVTRDVGDATIVIEVQGTPRRPQLVLSSDPPVYDQSQIVGIIVSGDPGTQHITNQSADSRVVGALSGVLVNKIKDQIAPMLPIDVLKVDTAGGDSGQTRLEVGKYLTDNLYLSYVHQFGTTTGTRRTNSNQANVEYHFKKHYALDTNFGDAGQGSVDLFWTLRY